MGINRSSFSATPLTDNTDITLELLQIRPDVTAYYDPPLTPNRMVGYFNNLVGGVELYITDGQGRRYIRVR